MPKSAVVHIKGVLAGKSVLQSSRPYIPASGTHLYLYTRTFAYGWYQNTHEESVFFPDSYTKRTATVPIGSEHALVRISFTGA